MLWSLRDNPDRSVAISFAAVVGAATVYDVIYEWAFGHAHTDGWAYGLYGLFVLLLVAGVLRRYRWVWWITVVFSVLALADYLDYYLRRSVSTTFVIGLTLGIVEFGLLISTPMRRYVGVRRSQAQR